MESDKLVEYDGLLLGKRGSKVMAIVMVAIAVLILLNMLSRYL